MFKNKKIIIFLILTLLWCGVIFFMSSMNNSESNGKSKMIIYKIITNTVEVTNKLGLTNKHPSDEKINEVIMLLNKPLRKACHATEYFILVVLLLLVLKYCGLSGKKIFLIAISLCFLYACSDEFHQSFISGRTAQFSDSLIDTSGALIGCSIYGIIYKLRKKKNIMIK